MEDYLLKSIATAGGIGGLYLVGLMIFIGKRILRLEEALDRLTKMELLRLVASPHVAPDVRVAASDLLEEVKTSQTRRTK